MASSSTPNSADTAVCEQACRGERVAVAGSRRWFAGPSHKRNARAAEAAAACARSLALAPKARLPVIASPAMPLVRLMNCARPGAGEGAQGEEQPAKRSPAPDQAIHRPVTP